MAENKMTRSSTDRMLGGVCAGLAKYFGWTPTNFRLFYVLLSVLSAAFPGILVYVLLWVFMPLEK
ncbi:MAG TPA: PspC domain-containing protein [Bacteroidetes bacterium]|nr:PspC domain-containing protein [Bacteroidota bacterium]